MSNVGDEPGVRDDATQSWVWPMGPVVALAIFAIKVVLWITIQRAFYPFELEWMEGGSLQHLDRILAGLPLYPPPSIDFVPFPYPPVYYYAAIPFAKLTGSSLLSLRIVSQLAMLAAFVAIFALVRRETRRWDLGIACAGLFAATYRISGAYMDVGRLDSLFVALTLASIYFLRTREDARGLVLAGLLASLAIFTKQTGLAIVVPMIVWCAYRDATTGATSEHASRFARTLWFGSTVIALTLVGTSWLSLGENGHFLSYVLGAQSGHAIRWALLPYFLWNDLLFALPVVVVGIVWGFWKSQDRVSFVFYLAFFIGTVVAWIVPRAKVGGAMNNLIPLHACVVVMFGVALGDRLNARPGRLRVTRAVAIGVALQFLWLGFDPRIALPRDEDAEAGRRFVRRLAATEGEVLMPAHGYLAGLAGKRVYAHQMPVDDLARSGLEESVALREEFTAAIAARRFAWIVDSTSRFLERYPDTDVLKRNYRIAGPVFDVEGRLTPRSGWQVAPGLVWVPLDAPVR